MKPITCPECGHEFTISREIKNRDGYHGGLSLHNSTIETMFKAGHTLREIAVTVTNVERQFHHQNRERVGEATIRYILRRLGYDVKARKLVDNKQRDVEIVELRESGLTLQQIGERFGISRTRVRGIVMTHERRRRYAAA